MAISFLGVEPAPTPPREAISIGKHLAKLGRA